MTLKAKDQPSTAFAAMLGNMPFNPMTDPRLKAWFDLGAEMMQFAASRIQRDVEAQKAMLACKSLEDLQKVQAEFYTEAFKDYSEQIQRAMGVMSAVAQSHGNAPVASTKRGYDDVPL